MIPAAYEKFISQVIKKTENDEVKWEKSFDESFMLKTKNGTVEIGFFINEDEELSYHFFNYRNYQTKSNAGFRVGSNETDFKLMQHLYTVAAASANNVVEELDNFLDEL